ncbi:cytochrome P450 [Pseudonocardia acaciae]|uniref:cytochrome P450 n=1 Tax=Pseudonocardia acaciae TaxID=551276 RepID=UPI000687DDA6|nr:cytochrome P450 [Pseudonocardia acaciae]
MRPPSTERPAHETTDAGATRASLLDTALVLGGVLLPSVVIGVIKRRPRLLRLARRARLDRMSIALMRRLRDRYGPGPLVLPLPIRPMALPLNAGHVERILADADTFHPGGHYKRLSLRHFQPHGVLISDEPERSDRRELNEDVLETDRPEHSLTAPMTAVIRDEVSALLAARDRLGWDEFNAAWWWIVRRIVLGDAARDDREPTDLLDRLRRDANWAGFHPRREGVRRRFDAALRRHLDRAEPGSLAGQVGARAADQVPHWLFAFDAAGMVTFRALALLATHPEQAAQARTPGPYAGACVLDTVRLWPTTPLLLREATRDTDWGRVRIPRGTQFVIFTPFFHRDAETLPYADRFAPRAWLDGTASAEAGLVPFSAGPARCPGRDLVLQVTGTVLAELTAGHEYRLLAPPRLDPDRPLPATLDNFGLTFAVRTRQWPSD